jgi:NitT/TauT family transport system substrate-binding protein
MAMSIRCALLAVVPIVLMGAAALAQQPAVVTIATVMSVPSVANFWAIEKGFFREAGVDVRVEVIDSLTKAVALLATNQIQLAQGGLNAGFFNAVGQGLPVALALESGSTPVNHNFIVRSDLKEVIKTPADLKGRNVAVSGAGSLSVYELASLMGAVGMTLADVNVKQLSFPQMAPAMASKALDVALMVAPFSDRAIAQNIGVPWIDPEEGFLKVLPMTSLAYMASADWVRQNRDIAGKVVLALIRAGRDYCQAYHHGPQRDEMLEMMVRHGIGADRDSLDRVKWQARTPDGLVNLDSLRDIKRVYKAEGLVERDPPDDRLVIADLAASAAKALGPFKLINEASPLKGCR